MTPADIQRIKDLLPTTLGSEDIREQIAAEAKGAGPLADEGPVRTLGGGLW